MMKENYIGYSFNMELKIVDSNVVIIIASNLNYYLLSFFYSFLQK
jgi:hypothetical protein